MRLQPAPAAAYTMGWHVTEQSDESQPASLVGWLAWPPRLNSAAPWHNRLVVLSHSCTPTLSNACVVVSNLAESHPHSRLVLLF